jgi:hypothetical protein
MTATTKPAPISHSSPAAPDAEQLLRDAAFVLRMVRKVKTELLADRPHTARVAASRSNELAVGLGM